MDGGLSQGISVEIVALEVATLPVTRALLADIEIVPVYI